MSGKERVPTIIVNDTRVDHHHGCSRVMEALEQLLAANGCHVIARAPAHGDWAADPGVVANARSARLVVVNGEGTIHHDRPAGLRLLRVGAWARARGIPAVLVNTGWEANGPDAVAMLAGFALVAVRDRRSAAEITQHGGECRVLPDLSLYLPWTDPDVVRQGLVFTDNVDRASTLRLDALRRDMHADWLPIQAAAPRAMERLAFVRHGIARSDLGDPRVAWGMARARWSMARARVASPDRFLEGLSRRQLLVTGRFHACTLAMLARTPFMALPSNTGKIRALLEDAGLSSWRCGTELTPSGLREAMRQGWDAAEREAMDRYIEAGREAADALFADIRRLA